MTWQGLTVKERNSESRSSYMALYDSTGILVDQNDSWLGLRDFIEFAKRYGLGQLYRLKSYVKTYIETFCKYDSNNFFLMSFEIQ